GAHRGRDGCFAQGTFKRRAAEALRRRAMNRRHFVQATLAAAMLGTGAAAMAQAYPSKPVTMIIPFPPGGTLDVVGRLLAQKLGEQMGQTFIVDNRPGGAGTIGAIAVQKAKADGYTLLFSPSTLTTTPM